MATNYKPRIDHSKKDYDSADIAQDKKVAKKAEKDALKKPKVVVVSKAPIPAANAKTALAVKKTAATAAAEPVAVKPVAKPLAVKPKAAVKKDEWTCPDDGQLYLWAPRQAAE